MRRSLSVVRSTLVSAGALAIVLAITACGSSKKASAPTTTAPTTTAPAKTNQTLQLASSSTDVDYSDPALAYGVPLLGDRVQHLRQAHGLQRRRRASRAT